MQEYKVTLMRSFVVTVQANDAQTAREMSELYVGYGDDSTPADRKKLSFSIEDIEMTNNTAIEAEQL